MFLNCISYLNLYFKKILEPGLGSRDSGAGAGRMAGAGSRLNRLHIIAHKIGERDGLVQ